MTCNEYIHTSSNFDEFNEKEILIDIEFSDAELIYHFYDKIEKLDLYPFFSKAFNRKNTL